MAAYKERDAGAAVQGFAEIQKALAEIDKGAAREMRKRLRNIGENVAVVARRNATNKSGRHDGPEIRDSIRVSITRAGASVYSTAPQGGAQNAGGRVGRGGKTILRRSDVSSYMTEAVKSQRANTAREIEGVLEWVDQTFRD